MKIIKSLTYLALSLALLVATSVTVIGTYKLNIDPKKMIINWEPAGLSDKDYSDPKFARIIRKCLLKNSLFITNRKVIYSIKDVDQSMITIDASNIYTLKNNYKSSLLEEIEIGLPKSFSTPEVEIDGVISYPTEVTPTSIKEIIRLYRINVPPGGEKMVSIKLKDLKQALPYSTPDVTTKPTLFAELHIEGEKQIMDKLNVATVGNTWRDNWEKANPHSTNQTVYGWRTKYPIFPYHGAQVLIDLK